MAFKLKLNNRALEFKSWVSYLGEMSFGIMKLGELG